MNREPATIKLRQSNFIKRLEDFYPKKNDKIKLTDQSNDSEEEKEDSDSFHEQSSNIQEDLQKEYAEIVPVFLFHKRKKNYS